jgi:hypothetical protein
VVRYQDNFFIGGLGWVAGPTETESDMDKLRLDSTRGKIDWPFLPTDTAKRVNQHFKVHLHEWQDEERRIVGRCLPDDELLVADKQYVMVESAMVDA